MGVGPNYVLDKGFLAEGSTAYAIGEIVKAGSVDGAIGRSTTSSATVINVGVSQEAVDASKVTTGKVILDVRLLGVARVIAGATIAVGDHLTNDTSARATPVTRAAAGAQPAHTFGIALTSTSTVGEHIDVLLTPGGTY